MRQKIGENSNGVLKDINLLIAKTAIATAKLRRNRIIAKREKEVEEHAADVTVIKHFY